MPGPQFLWDTLKRILLLGAGLATAILFFIILFQIDPFPYIRQAAYFMGLQQVVAFEEAIPVNLAENLAVTKVQRADTDGDGFNEWVVFYKFDKRAKNSPIMGAVYDNDRGNPPVIFPYPLRAPDRNYLSESALGLTLSVEQIAKDQNGPNKADVKEMVIQGDSTLTIFRFRQNSETWDFPRDVPSRYEAIGFFRGNDEVKLDRQTKQVTVYDRNGFERSQLTIRSVYGLRVDPATNNETYLDPVQPLGGVGSPSLAAPLISTIDFYPSPPDDIFNTPYPEKIVLGFYTATCAAKNKTLCNSYKAAWDPRTFLTGDALTAFDRGDSAYFGLPGVRGMATISVSRLRYYPETETDSDLLETGQGRDVVTGEEGQVGLVEISFTVNDSSVLQTRRYEVRQVTGQWKIQRVLPTVASESGGSASFESPASTPAPLVSPRAEANGPYNGVACRPITFSSAGSTDPDGAITGYQWNFGDGSALAGDPNPAHVYTNPGVFNITLVVTDNAGLSSQDTTTVKVGIPAPPPPNCSPAPCCG